ncbi:MAG: enoyl-CoA hydratase-related protein [Myxococcota bacterium]|jgi:enoyl-CoA hydratase|nr:enoyl-CoA hydratase-related protein [Myxococcota bacterium]
MPILLETPTDHPHVAVVTLDRPERANALDPAMLTALAKAWRTIADAPDIRVAIVRGAGDRVFCSGMDVAATLSASQQLHRGERVSEDEFEGLRCVSTALLAGFDLGRPLICAINGHARAGGFDLMLASEIRIAVPEATFALEEVALGLYPTGNASVMLPRQIGWAHAHEIMLTAKPFDAEKAARIGVINEIVERDQLMPRAFELADTIAGNAPLAVSATRNGVRELLGMDLESAYIRQEEIGAPLRKTEDAREAQRAFMEKRPPVFKGR